MHKPILTTLGGIMIAVLLIAIITHHHSKVPAQAAQPAPAPAPTITAEVTVQNAAPADATAAPAASDDDDDAAPQKEVPDDWQPKGSVVTHITKVGDCEIWRVHPRESTTTMYVVESTNRHAQCQSFQAR